MTILASMYPSDGAATLAKAAAKLNPAELAAALNPDVPWPDKRNPSGLTIYDISIDETRPLTQTDLDALNNVYSAFAIQREAGKALAALALAVGQAKLSQTAAWDILRPLTEWNRTI